MSKTELFQGRTVENWFNTPVDDAVGDNTFLSTLLDSYSTTDVMLPPQKNLRLRRDCLLDNDEKQKKMSFNADSLVLSCLEYHCLASGKTARISTGSVRTLVHRDQRRLEIKIINKVQVVDR